MSNIATNTTTGGGAGSRSGPRRHAAFSLPRVWALARNTFTQLARMKVFYFMLIFIVLVIAVNFLFLGWTLDQQLKSISDVAFGAMRLFSAVFAIVGTALLIPKDVEDRTLYTILTKPVPRIEYLLGKLAGVLLLVAASIAMMAVLYLAVLYMRQGQILEQMIADHPHIDPEQLRETVFAQGVRADLVTAVVALFLQAAVAAGVALLVSTFASSTLFTIVVSLMVFLVGHGQSLAREVWLGGGEGVSAAAQFFSGMVALIFPDFSLFVLYDGIAEGQSPPAGTLPKLGLLTLFYLAVYSIASWLVFAKKEL